MMNAVLENGLIEMLAERFRRCPSQVNKLQESDAELVRLGNSLYLAVTTDSIAEEIASGMYSDPYLIGWMTVMASLSDLAAVGARAVGLVISEMLPHSLQNDFLVRLQNGISDACETCQTFVLGGDTNTSAQLVLTGCAFGIVNSSQAPVGRIGCRPGDMLYASGPLGSGNAFALAQFVNHATESTDYLPVARLQEGEMISQIATSRMDTSDGVLATLDQLMRLNSVGFAFDDRWEEALSPKAREIAVAYGVPPWLLLAGQHGEFELLFTVPARDESRLDEIFAQRGNKPLRLGIVTPKPEICLTLYGGRTYIGTGMIRNIACRSGNDIESTIQHLLRIDEAVRKGAFSHEHA